MLVDSHCHLDDRRFSADRSAVLDRARAAGVTHLVTVGCELETIPRARALAATHADVWCTAGLHPHHAAQVTDDDVEGLEGHFRDPRVVAVGECGLDFFYDFSPRDRQVAVMARQVALARRVRRPLVVHVRDAHPLALEVLRAEGAADVGGIIHCFTAGWAEARAYLDLGFDVSVPGVLTFAHPGELPEVVRRVPRDRLLVETDSPYLAPAPQRGKRNEPAWVRRVADAVAEVWGVEPEEAAAQTGRNAVGRLKLQG
jgi:TatD DNase family protein